MRNRIFGISKYRFFEFSNLRKIPWSDLSDQSDLSDSSDKKLVDPLTRRLFDLLKFVAFCSY